MPHWMVDSKFYGWDLPDKALLRSKNRLLLLGILNAVISLLCGIISTGVNRHPWVGFAATAALMALMMEVIAAVRFRMAKTMLNRHTFDSVHHMMRWSAQCHMTLMAVALIAGIVSCIQAFDGILDLVVLAGFIFCFACSFLFLTDYDRIPTQTIQAPE